MQVFERHAKPWAKPSGINMEKSELYLILIEKCFPNVFDFFLKSTAMSKISPSTTDINFPWGFFFENVVLL